MVVGHCISVSLWGTSSRGTKYPSARADVRSRARLGETMVEAREDRAESRKRRRGNMIQPKAVSQMITDEFAALYHDRKRLTIDLELILTPSTDQLRGGIPDPTK